MVEFIEYYLVSNGSATNLKLCIVALCVSGEYKFYTYSDYGIF